MGVYTEGGEALRDGKRGLNNFIFGIWAAMSYLCRDFTPIACGGSADGGGVNKF